MSYHRPVPDSVEGGVVQVDEIDASALDASAGVSYGAILAKLGLGNRHELIHYA